MWWSSLTCCLRFLSSPSSHRQRVRRALQQRGSPELRAGRSIERTSGSHCVATGSRDAFRFWSVRPDVYFSHHHEPCSGLLSPSHVDLSFLSCCLPTSAGLNDAITNLCAVIGRNQQLRRFNLSGFPLKRPALLRPLAETLVSHQTVKEVEFYNCQLTEPMAWELQEILKDNKNIVSLNLGENG